jgi:hypothetical protein
MINVSDLTFVTEEDLVLTKVSATQPCLVSTRPGLTISNWASGFTDLIDNEFVVYLQNISPGMTSIDQLTFQFTAGTKICVNAGALPNLVQLWFLSAQDVQLIPI